DRAEQRRDPAMNVVVAEQALALARSRQRRYDDCIAPEKRRAKARAAAIIGRRPGAKVLDVGHEPFYAPEFETRGMTLVPLNLPDGDMHTLSAVEEYDGALAMHVLEHSPFPLYVLMLLDRKSTRLNSSHVKISYAVFCLKKKKKDTNQ